MLKKVDIYRDLEEEVIKSSETDQEDPVLHKPSLGLLHSGITMIGTKSPISMQSSIIHLIAVIGSSINLLFHTLLPCFKKTSRTTILVML
jgi:hypothetical protein